MTRFSRRLFHRNCLALAALGLAPAASAIGPGSKVRIGQIQTGGVWDSRPEAARRILWETGKRSSIDVGRDAAIVELHTSDIFQHPLLLLTGTGAFEPFSAESRGQLGRHLRYGGLLYVDGEHDDILFWESVNRELQLIFPQERIKDLPRDHVLFKSFFLLDKVVGRTEQKRPVQGIDLHDRTAVIMTRNDVLGALERDKLGSWKYECVPGGNQQRELAIRFTINLMMYATCLDYKSDQVHIPFIMKKKRR